MYSQAVKEKVRVLRSEGKTYSEIMRLTNLALAKSTIADWCKTVVLSKEARKLIETKNSAGFQKMRASYLKNKDERLRTFYEHIDSEFEHFSSYGHLSTQTQKMFLALLYLAEGAKNKSSVMFGNSDPRIISLFVDLMRKCYKINESKFRCTVQCRAGQNVSELEKFWSHLTRIPLAQFYKARIDKRTIGQETKKADYKGVCRIDYFSSALDRELKYIADKMTGL